MEENLGDFKGPGFEVLTGTIGISTAEGSVSAKVLADLLRCLAEEVTLHPTEKLKTKKVH